MIPQSKQDPDDARDIKVADEVMARASTKLNREAFSKNMDILSEGIMKAIELAQAHSWHTWDSFAGRTVYHSNSLRDAQKEAVKIFLTNVFSDKP